MLRLFRKKKVYPSKYFEWADEFKKHESVLLDDETAEMLSGGILSDKKYTADSFERDLAEFAKKQLIVYIEKYTKEVRACMENSDCEYLLLTIRRNSRLGRNILFFERLEFLDKGFKARLAADLRQKFDDFDRDLLSYIEKYSEYIPSMSEVCIGFKRLIRT